MWIRALRESEASSYRTNPVNYCSNYRCAAHCDLLGLALQSIMSKTMRRESHKNSWSKTNCCPLSLQTCWYLILLCLLSLPVQIIFRLTRTHFSCLFRARQSELHKPQLFPTIQFPQRKTLIVQQQANSSLMFSAWPKQPMCASLIPVCHILNYMPTSCPHYISLWCQL